MFASWVCAVTLLGSIPAQDSVSDTTSRGLLRDVDVLERTYQALHPGIYRYNSEAELDAAYAELRREFSRDRTMADAYLAISRFLAKIKCGHTYANFFNQPDVVTKSLFDQPNKVPFTFRWINKVMVVTRDVSLEKTFPRGTEILSINGVTTRSILSQLMRYARADGSNDAKRIADLEVLGGARYEAFDVFFPLVYPSTSPSSTFKIRKPNAKTVETVTATLVLSATRLASATEASDNGPAWSLSYPKSNVGLLTMPTWAMYNRKWDWKAFLRSAFDELRAKSVPNLVIDLRGNEGGDSVGDFILPQIITEKVISENYQRYTRYRTVPQVLRENLSTWDSSFYDWGKSAQPDPNGFFKLTRFDDLRGSVISPSKTPYQGKLFLLVGPENSSATFEFAYQVQRLKLGTLVGRPTGGNLRGINGGAFFFLTLPNSKIEVDVPLIAQFFPQKRPDRGVQPDVVVAPTLASVVEGRDIELAKVFDLIGQVRNHTVVMEQERCSD